MLSKLSSQTTKRDLSWCRRMANIGSELCKAIPCRLWRMKICSSQLIPNQFFSTNRSCMGHTRRCLTLWWRMDFAGWPEIIYTWRLACPKMVLSVGWGAHVRLSLKSIQTKWCLMASLFLFLRIKLCWALVLAMKDTSHPSISGVSMILPQENTSTNKRYSISASMIWRLIAPRWGENASSWRLLSFHV